MAFDLGAASAAARLTIVHVTDIYILDNFPSLRTLISKKKAENPNTISMLTGDFLAPYLLSSLDHGAAMMDMIVMTPIDYLTWGNHEADIPHDECCKRCQEYSDAGGVWINSNMQSHEMMTVQKDYEVVEVESADGKHSRHVGLIAVMTDDPSLYKKFKSPGAFNGAAIDSPWETLQKYKKVLEEKEKVDLVLPLQHLYEFQDERTCKEFDFPVILSGHDHHKVDKEVSGTRLLKPGSDGHYATILDITWETPQTEKPAFSWEFVKVQDFQPDAEMVTAMKEAYAPLDKIRNTELTPVPQHFRPLSSVNSRGAVTTMGKLICTLVRDAVISDPKQHDCEICLIRGGHICGEKDFPPDSIFSLEDLKTVNTDNVSIEVVEIPGAVIVEGVKSTRGAISRLFVQYDDSVVEENGEITQLAGAPVDLQKMYWVATTPTTLRDIKVFSEYFKTHTQPDPEEFVPLETELMAYCGRRVWKQILALCDPSGTGDADLSALDTDGDGVISIEEIQAAMGRLGYRFSKEEYSLVHLIVNLADEDANGEVSADEVRNAVRQESGKRRASVSSMAAGQNNLKSSSTGIRRSSLGDSRRSSSVPGQGISKRRASTKAYGMCSAQPRSDAPKGKEMSERDAGRHPFGLKSWRAMCPRNWCFGQLCG